MSPGVVSTQRMKASASLAVVKRALRPDATCSTRPTKRPRAGSLSDPNCRTNALSTGREGWDRRLIAAVVAGRASSSPDRTRKVVGKFPESPEAF
jgi:hypothetical protein